jgi:putative ABC transport system permease protein
MLRLILYGWRSWRHAKPVAGLAILALATGIGSATAVFTVVNSVLLNPLPYLHSDRWVALFGGSTLEPQPDWYTGLSIADLTDYQQRTRSFDAFGWYSVGGRFNLSSRGVAERVEGTEVTASLLNAVGVRAIAGRLFRDADGSQVALLSSRLWQRLRPDIDIGKSIALDGRSYAVVGVLPSGFRLPIVTVGKQNSHNDVWVPVQTPAGDRNYGFYAAYARLKPGVTVQEARADAERVAGEIRTEYGRENSYTAKVFGLEDFVVRDIRPYLVLLMAAAGLLLLITCANVGGLLVARSVHRAHEIAVRTALGARKSQLALQFIVEGCFLSMVAAGLGVLASIGLTRLILSLAADYIPRSDEVSIHGAVLLFAAGLALLTALLPALVPLRQAIHTQPTEVLSSGVRATGDFRRRRLSRSLVVAEITLAFLLLSASGLLLSEFESLRHIWPGFNPRNLLTFQIEAPQDQFRSSGDLLAYHSKLLAALNSLPGVKGAAITDHLPIDCCMTHNIYPEGEPYNPGLSRDISVSIVSPGYFSTLQVPLQKGRLLDEHDTSEKLISVVIDEAAAERYWRGRDPVGSFGRLNSPQGSRFQVVGVVGNIKVEGNEGLEEAKSPEIYVLDALDPVRQMNVLVRSDLPSASLLPAIRRSTESAGPTLPMYDVGTMNELVDDSAALQRFASVVVTFFALAALMLACLGIYSMTSFSLRERAVEFGTRMALGASPGDLLRLILGDSCRMAAMGILVGIPAAVGTTRLVMHFLHLHHIGALPYASSLLVVGGLATAASVGPAWRATLISPLVAIRQESETFWTSGRRGLAQIRHAIKTGGKSPPRPTNPTKLQTDFIEATRRADSFPQALGVVLSELRTAVQSQSVMLFEKLSPSEACFQCRAASPEIAIRHALPAAGYLLGRLKFHSLLTFRTDELDTVLRWASEHQPRYVPEVEYLKQMGIGAAVPLRVKDEITGLLLFGPPFERQQYSSADRDLIEASSQQLSLLIENARLTDRVVEQEKMRRDVTLAAEVQKKLLAQSSIENGASSAAAFYLPARVVGGDCYDFLDLGDDGVGIALADVAGKGVAAALIMAALQVSLRIITSDGRMSPAQVTGKLNRLLQRSIASSSYATFFYAQIPPGSHKLRYVNAGHNPPRLLRVSTAGRPGGPPYQCVEQLKAGGTVVGLFPDAIYDEGDISLSSGDVVFVFTDGVTEAFNPTEEEFGEERLDTLLSQVAHLPVNEIVSSVSEKLREWISDAPRHDDLTFVVIKFR